MSFAAPRVNTGESPLYDILISARQLLISCWYLFNALVRAAFYGGKVFFLSAQQLYPHMKPIFRMMFAMGLWLWDAISGLSAKGRIVLSSSLCFSLFLYYGCKSGLFTSCGKKCRRLCRRTDKTMRFYGRAVKEFMCYLGHLAIEFITILMPSFTVLLPLRLYLARHVFRQMFTVSTFTTSVCLSIKSLVGFYRSPYPDTRPSPPQSGSDSRSVIVRSNRRRSLADCSRVEEDKQQHECRLKRKTVGECGPRKRQDGQDRVNGLFGIAGSLFSGQQRPQQRSRDPKRRNNHISEEDTDEDKGVGNAARSTLLPRHPKIRDSNDDDAVGVHEITLWLHYWVVSSVFDLLLMVPITVSRLFIRSLLSHASFPIQFVGLGHLEEATPLLKGPSSVIPSSPSFQFSFTGITRSTSPSLWTQLLYPSSWKLFSFADSYFGVISLFHDFTYSVILVLVVNHKHQYLVAVRRILVGILDTVIYTVSGLEIIPSLCPEGQPSNSWKGWIPQGWVILQPYLPSSVHLAFHLLSYGPQIFLLLLPSFLQRPAVFGVAVLYPLIGSLRSLESSDYRKQAYWLNYFILSSFYETLFMRWFRSTSLWAWVPCRWQLELVMVILLQLLCLWPQGILPNLFPTIVASFTVNPSTPKTQATTNIIVRDGSRTVGGEDQQVASSSTRSSLTTRPASSILAATTTTSFASERIKQEIGSESDEAEVVRPSQTPVLRRRPVFVGPDRQGQLSSTSSAPLSPAVSGPAGLWSHADGRQRVDTTLSNPTSAVPTEDGQRSRPTQGRRRTDAAAESSARGQSASRPQSPSDRAARSKLPFVPQAALPSSCLQERTSRADGEMTPSQLPVSSRAASSSSPTPVSGNGVGSNATRGASFNKKTNSGSANSERSRRYPSRKKSAKESE